MRFSLVTLFFWSSTVLAGTFGAEQPLTPPNDPAVGHELPSISVAGNGVAGLWNAGATLAGRASWQNTITNSAALTLDPKPHRDGGVASIGDESYAAWIEEDWLYGQRIDSNGQLAGPATLLQQVDSRHTMRMAITANRNEYFVVWPQLSRIVGTTLDAQGNSINWIANIVDGTFGRNIEKVAVASNGTDFLVVWEATSDEPWLTPCAMGCPGTDRDVHSVVVGSDGNPRPGTETLLATGAGMPDVVWTGTDYVVAWSSLPSGGAVVRHVGVDGVPRTDAAPLTTSGDWSPALVWDGSAVDIAFARAGDPGSPAQLIVLRLAADDTISAVPPTPLLLGTAPRQFALASDGNTTAIAYTANGRIFTRYLGAAPPPPSRTRAANH